MLDALVADHLGIVVAVVAAATVLGCLRTIGHERAHLVRWHRLRHEIHALRREQRRRLRELAEERRVAAGGAPAPPADQLAA